MKSDNLITMAKWLVYLWIAFIMTILTLIFLLRWVNPPTSAVIIAEQINLGKKIPLHWKPIEEMGENISLTVVAAEDSNFCDHFGFDISEILKVRTTGSLRGASTITQQVAKNLFLWRGRSWLRKGMEAVLTIFIEIFWPKKRILEVYLNIAETGKGSFGVSTISKHKFGKRVENLSLKEASYITVTLPNPKKRNALKLNSNLLNKAKRIRVGAKNLKITSRASCFLN